MYKRQGFMYADWKSQVAYSSPNWNGFSFTVGLTQAWNAHAAGAQSVSDALDTLLADPTGGGIAGPSGAFGSSYSSARGGSSPAFEGKASYEWTGDFAGKVWVSGFSQNVKNLAHTGIDPTGTVIVTTQNGNDRANAWDIGATVNVAGFGLTGYYGQGDGIGQTLILQDGFDSKGKSRDSDQWYLQATYTLPGVGTKLGASYGESTLDGNSATDKFKDIEDSMWTVGAYHPLTKHLNLVAEYSESERDVSNRGAADDKAKAKTIALGAILFF